MSQYLIIDPPDAAYDESYQSPIDLPYKLDVFQQQAAKAIYQEHNALLSCATGSGKTVPCLVAINYYLKKNKRVIYTSPIKSLSNQKYKEFSDKIPDVGIMTGDIKCNPDAQCVIMTTEILRNMLYKQENTTSNTSDTLDKHKVEMSEFLKNVGCVIFDEIHYINDKDRGKIWEESIVMLPPSIRILGCSGTIDQPERFASWIGDIKKVPIHLIRTIRRPIPLNHYIYVENLLTHSQKSQLNQEKKQKKDEATILREATRESYAESSESNENKEKKEENLEKKGMIHIMKGDLFLASNYALAYNQYQNKCVDPITKKQTKVGNPRYAKSQAPGDLNTFLDFLKKGRYLPSLIFVLSRKRVEEYAAAVQISVLDHEERNEVGKLFDINMSKFGNQYKELGQYEQVRNLLLKGIGIHHSGLIPVLKEVVEILFSKGLIKFLFATETFAIGVNMPTKTVVFTEFEKPTGTSFQGSGGLGVSRLLKTDEYLQMSGRAGRRGLDSSGTVIIFPLRELPNHGEMTMMMTGKTPSITSKFCPGYQFLLKCLVNGKDIWQILGSSLRSRQDKALEEALEKEKSKKIIEYEEVVINYKKKYGENIMDLATNYHNLFLKTQPRMMGGMTIKPTKDKALDKKIAELAKKVTKACYKDYLAILELKEELGTPPHATSETVTTAATSDAAAAAVDVAAAGTKDSRYEKMKPVFDYLVDLGYLEKAAELKPTLKGIIASEINDSNCILMTEMIMQGFFDELSGPEMLALLALFIEEFDKTEEEQSIEDKKRQFTPSLGKMVDRVLYMRDDLERLEEEQVLSQNIHLDTEWSVYLDFVQIAYLWASGSGIAEIYAVTNIYEGNFVKNMLRLQSSAEGITEIFKTLEKHEQANKLKEVSQSIIRGIVTNNSLYVN